MDIPFCKYQGTGNDFVIIDQRHQRFLRRGDTEIIQRICDRKFGIGADGLILLQHLEGYDFEMIYFNADGNESSMCGNGGRCITAFAKRLGMIESDCSFLAIDGPHEAKINADNCVELKMADVAQIEIGEDFFVLDTGSPHYIVFVEDVDDINVADTGAAIRYSKPYRKEGINVNFVEKTENGLLVATYERGVEDETLSCGTGVTAAALAHGTTLTAGQNEIPIRTKGGQLSIKFDYSKINQSFSDIWLCGPATLVFEGSFFA